MTAMIPTTINGQWDLLLPEHRAVRPEWKTGWERERLDSMHEHLTRVAEDVAHETRPTDPAMRRPVIIDVGVEEGDLTALYSLWGCDVVMVEPNPRVWPNVRVIWEANGLRPPLLWWLGFAAERSSATYWAMEEGYKPDPDDSRTWWPAAAYGPVIGDHAFLHLAQHEDIVSTITLDRLAGPLGRKVDAITMDVEGSELRVLHGATRILTEDRPLVWVSVHTDAQWMDENYPLDGRDAVVNYMAGVGYDGTLLAIDHEEHWFFEPTEAIR